MNSSNLKRTIGLVSATSIGLGAMLGAGIFVFPGLAGGDAGFAAIISFIIGGVIALFTAACTAELATAMPYSGGGYFFISRSFGPFWGTLVGIAQWVGLIFACAFYLVSFGEYSLNLLAELKINWSGSAKFLSFCFTLILFAVNIFGTKKVGRLQNLMVITLTVILVLLFSYGLIDYFGLKEKPVVFSGIAPKGIGSIFTTAALVFTAYLGFVQIANIGSEIKQPSKNLPRSLLLSVLIAMSLYVFIMLVCVLTFPQEQLKQFGETATIEVARKMLGGWAAILVVFAGILATLSSANSSMISASRGVFALSKDELISTKASAINGRFGTPHIALILVTLPVAVMLIKSRIEIFAEVASFLHLIIYAGICLSVLKFNLQTPVWYIPTFRVPAVRIVAGLGTVSCLSLLFFMQKTSILIGSGVLLLAAVYYLVYVRRQGIGLQNPNPPHVDASLFKPSVLLPINITQDKKDLPKEILEAVPMSKVLLLGFKETPEQSDSEQSESAFKEEAANKLSNIQDQLEETNINFDAEMIFSNEVKAQFKALLEEKELEFILTLQALSNLSKLVVLIFDSTQINKKLSTIVYKLQSNKPSKLKVILFDEEGESSKENQLKEKVKNQFDILQLHVDEFEIHAKEKVKSPDFMKKISTKGNLVICAEEESTHRDFFLSIILSEEFQELDSPFILILKKE